MKNALTLLLHDLGISKPALAWLYQHADKKMYYDVLHNPNKPAILSEKDLEILANRKKVNDRLNYISKLLQEHQRQGIKYVCYFEKHYPEKFRNLENPPMFIFYKGNFNLLKADGPASIVGTRNPSPYTIENVKYLALELVRRYIVIVSGLARGTDTYAHEMTVNLGGKAIAVLPTPLLNIYPKENIPLANKIVQNGGLLISAYYKERVHKYQFVERNQLIAALSHIMVISECDEKSGSIHAARFAHEEGCYLYCFNNDSPGVRKIREQYGAGTYYGLDLEIS